MRQPDIVLTWSTEAPLHPFLLPRHERSGTRNRPLPYAMKIDKITITNLTSFEGTFTIDFTLEPLRSAGLFAITGDTGAGKSTILDAVCLALYNRAPRFDAAEKLRRDDLNAAGEGERSVNANDVRNLLRRGQRNAAAEVEFTANDGSRYRAEWSLRLKRTGTYDKVERTLERLSKPTLRIVGEKEISRHIVEVTGLDYAQFSRTVMLAQNSFANFLRAKQEEKSVLLEKITGTEVYGRISEEIHSLAAEARQKLELAKTEREVLQRNRLCEEDLTEAQTQSTLLQTALTRTEENLKHIERQQQWFKAYDEALATLDLRIREYNNANKEYLALTGERVALARYDDVLCQQRLYNEIATLRRSMRQNKEEQSKLELQIRENSHRVEAAEDAWKTAQARLFDAQKQAELRQPEIKRGHELTGEISTAEKQLREREEDLQQAQLALGRRRADFLDKTAQLEKLQKDIDALQMKIQSLAVYKSMFDRYEMVMSKLKDLGEESDYNEKLHDDAEKIRQERTRLRQLIENAEKTIHEQEAELNAKNSELSIHERANDGLNGGALQQQLGALTARLLRLQQARRLWMRLSGEYEDCEAAQIRANSLRIEAEQLKKDLDEAERQVATASTEHKVLQELYAFHKSESVERLREQLREGMACPVCGSHHHPYHTEQAREMGKIADEVERRFLDAEDTLQAVSSRKERLSGSYTAVSTHCQNETEKVSRLQASIQADEAEWKDYAALDPDFATCSAGVNREARLMTIDQLIDNTGQGLEETEKQLRDFNLHQAAINTLNTSIRQLKDTLSERKEATLKLNKDFEVNDSKHSDNRNNIDLSDRKLKQLFSDLDESIPDSGWLVKWRQNPEGYELFISQLFRDWERTSKHLEEAWQQEAMLRESLSKADSERATAEEAVSCQREKRDESSELVRRRKDELRQLFGGKLPDEVSSELRQHIDCYTEGLEEATRTKVQAEMTANQLKGQRRGLAETLVRLQEENNERTTQLDHWMANYNRTHSPLQYAELEEIFADKRDWQALRRQLEDSQNALLLAQHRQAEADAALKLVEQQSGRPSDKEEETRDLLEEMHRQVLEERENTAFRLGEVRQRLLRHEEAGRSVAAMEARLNEAHDNAEWWTRLSAIFGSADGKKFRELAQSYTFGFLVENANAQLQALSPRYRLRTIPGTLALEIVDRDMYDEVRHVTSLSGGETFVVSLSLALALANLSGGDLAIGSLFIDEGFGNLDHDSLDLVMDALGNLDRGQGRKVGIISHTDQIRTQISPQIRLVKEAVGGKSRVVIA